MILHRLDPNTDAGPNENLDKRINLTNVIHCYIIKT